MTPPAKENARRCRVKPPCFDGFQGSSCPDYKQPIVPRKYLKKVLPGLAHVKELWGFRYLEKWLGHPNLWHINRSSIALGAAVGLFVSYLPVPGQSLIAAAAAILVRANLPLSVVLVWITNPLTIVPMYAPAYLLGSSLLGDDPVHHPVEWTVAALGHDLGALWLGCLLFGAALAALGWTLVHLYWRWHVRSSWDTRRRRRAAALRVLREKLHLRHRDSDDG